MLSKLLLLTESSLSMSNFLHCEGASGREELWRILSFSAGSVCSPLVSFNRLVIIKLYQNLSLSQIISFFGTPLNIGQG